MKYNINLWFIDQGFPDQYESGSSCVHQIIIDSMEPINLEIVITFSLREGDVIEFSSESGEVDFVLESDNGRIQHNYPVGGGTDTLYITFRAGAASAGEGAFLVTVRSYREL